MKLIVNIFLGAYCIALRGYRIMDVPIFGLLEPILNLIFQLPFLRKRIKAKGMTVKEYTNKEILKSKQHAYMYHKKDAESGAMTLICILLFILFLSASIALKLIFNKSLGLVLIRKNIATILFANIALSYICTCLTVYKCNIEKEMKRINRLSLKSQNSYIKYFVIFCISVLLLLEVAMEFLHAR